MRLRALLLTSLLAAFAPTAAVLAQHDAPMTSLEDRAALHSGPDWQIVEPHLPNPKTASAAALETAGDVLQARRFPEDALDFYGYAIARGGDVSNLLNKMGIIRLELHQNDMAHAMFLRTVRARKNNAQAWNNLGVTEYANHNYNQAIADYKRASQLDKRSAVYHSNLGMAYFETKDMETARKQLALAIQLDPTIMQRREDGGSTAHVLGSQNYPELCFEMAKLYAHRNDIPQMKLWLAKSSEGGFDVRAGMREDAVMLPYLKDAEVKMMLSNAAQMRKRSVAAAAAPSLGDAPKVINTD
jgi:tetratricopeptide (TPR) repeat protein